VIKKYRVTLTLTARTDLNRIFYYIAADSPPKALTFIEEIEEKVHSLGTLPDRQPLIPENVFVGADYRHLVYKKYRIIYRISGNDVYILRIFHGSKLLDF